MGSKAGRKEGERKEKGRKKEGKKERRKKFKKETNFTLKSYVLYKKKKI